MKAPHYALRNTVDQLGEIKAQIADLQKIETKLKTKLSSSGFVHVEGKYYCASIVQQDYDRLDTAKIPELVSKAVLRRLMKTVHRVQVRVTARKTNAA